MVVVSLDVPSTATAAGLTTGGALAQPDPLGAGAAAFPPLSQRTHKGSGPLARQPRQVQEQRPSPPSVTEDA